MIEIWKDIRSRRIDLRAFRSARCQSRLSWKRGITNRRRVLGAGLGHSIILGNGKAMHLRMASASEREWDSMQQDDAAETKRHDESARTPVAAKKGVTAKKVLEHIDPERLSKAIRYLKEHPKFVR